MVGTENMNVARSDVDGIDQLSLILPKRFLIKLIRRLESVARQKQIQVKRVLRVRAVVNPIEEVHSQCLDRAER